MSTIDSANKYPSLGPAISLEQLVKNKPGLRLEGTAARLEEHKVWEAQMEARNEAIQRYSQEHPAKIYGQVVVNGKLYATVWDNATTQLPGPMPGLTSDGGSSLEIAKARLREIAQAVKGEIRYSNFMPLPGGGSEFSAGEVPESFLATLPPITARRFRLDDELLAQLRQAEAELFKQREEEKRAAANPPEPQAVNQPE